MWACPKCRRSFNRSEQPHSCRSVSIENHFENKEYSKELFDFLTKQIEKNIGNFKIVSIPCCIHLFGKYDFLATLPKKDRLEIRFALDRVIDSKKLKQYVPLSSKSFKNCIDIYLKEDIDKELIGYLNESYNLKAKD